MVLLVGLLLFIGLSNPSQGVLDVPEEVSIGSAAISAIEDATGATLPAGLAVDGVYADARRGRYVMVRLSVADADLPILLAFLSNVDPNFYDGEPDDFLRLEDVDWWRPQDLEGSRGLIVRFADYEQGDAIIGRDPDRPFRQTAYVVARMF